MQDPEINVNDFEKMQAEEEQPDRTLAIITRSKPEPENGSDDDVEQTEIESQSNVQHLNDTYEADNGVD